MPLSVTTQGIGDSWINTKSALVATQVTSRKAPAVTASIMSEPEMMIVGLSAQGSSFSHSRRLRRFAGISQPRMSQKRMG